MNKFGYFNWNDPQLQGLKYGNWGSRPYEYAWCSHVESCEGKKVLDIGTGLPSEHNWNRYVQQQMKPAFYLGFDMDSRLAAEEIDEDDHKVKCLNAMDLPYPDGYFDFCFSISTFEHIDRVSDFEAVMKETHRVLAPDSLMVVTLDEIWDINNKSQTWNELERALIREGIFDQKDTSFSIKEFADLIKDWFEPVVDSIPTKVNADPSLLHHAYWNSAVSYGIFRRR